MKKKAWLLSLALLVAAISVEVIRAQQRVDVATVSAPATGQQDSAHSDSVVASNDQGGVIPILYDAATNGRTTIVNGTTGKQTYVRFLSVINDSPNSVAVTFGRGTGGACIGS